MAACTNASRIGFKTASQFYNNQAERKCRIRKALAPYGGQLDSSKFQLSLSQWRDSLINLSNGNKLLNYKKSRGSLELDSLGAKKVFDRVCSKKPTFIVGSKLDSPKKSDRSSSEELEDLAIEEMASFDYTAHPNSLIADATQREVERTLKTIANAAKREFLEKGLSPLYLALGAMSWVDDDEEVRKSPLILVPVELSSSGSKEPLRILRSEDDISVNPALAIKMLEFGITIPNSEEVIAAIDEGGLELAVDLFRAIKISENWSIDDFAALSVFGFQKEAMYRDLLDNEETILESQVVQALAGSSELGESEFFFEPIEQDRIDELAPPELATLILDADSSQRAAVAAALAGESFVLDGPPGTGKSQTISNIIGALIGDGKSVLFVSEKIVALEVVKSRLDSKGLGAFLFELHSHKTTRKEVAKHLGQALRQNPIPPSSMSPEDLSRAEKLRIELNDYALAMNEVRRPLNLSVHRALGLLEALDVEKSTPEPDFDVKSLTHDQFSLAKDAIERVGRHWDLHLSGDSATWFGLEDADALPFRIDSAISALSRFEKNYAPIHSAALALRISGDINGDNLYEVLEYWAGDVELHDNHWLTSKNLDQQKDSILRLRKLLRQIEVEENACAESLGPRWKEIPQVLAIPKMAEFSHLSSLVTGWDEMFISNIGEYADWASSAEQGLQSAVSEIDNFCTGMGITSPSSFSELRDFLKSLAWLEAEEMPPVQWLRGSKNLKDARASMEALRPLTQALIRAKSDSNMFQNRILEMDPRGNLDYFARNKGFLKSLSGEYRERKKALRGCSEAADWKQTLGDLHHAVKWQTSVDNLKQMERSKAEALGSLYASTETDWQLVGEHLEVAAQITAGLEVIDAQSFENASESKSLRLALRENLEDLTELVSDWDLWMSFQSCIPAPKIENKTLASLAETVAGATAEISQIVSLQGELSQHVPKSQTVGSLLLGLTQRNFHWSTLESVSTVSKEVHQFLNREVSAEDLKSKEVLDFFDRKLNWAEQMRSLVNKGRGSENLIAPLTNEDCATLETVTLPSEFKDSSGKWKECWTALKSAFRAELSASLDAEVAEFGQAKKYLVGLNSSLSEIDSYLDLKKSVDVLSKLGLGAALEEAAVQELGEELAPRYIEKSMLSSWVKVQMSVDDRLSDDPTFGRGHFIEEYRSLDRKIRDFSVAEIVRNAVQRRPRGLKGEAAVIVKESEKKIKHIPVRELIDKSRHVIQDLQPCFMMSPLAVSQYLPADLKFDVVIFDEASQVTPADAINCVYRGSALITAGDQKQLPPMSFFAASGLEDDGTEEDVAGDYDSILDLMKASGSFSSLTLNWHYRSRHEHLIAYSNLAFYESRLITFPGALEHSENLGVKFIPVKGVYRRGGAADNPKEAIEVAKRVMHHFDSRPDLSLGVVAFSTSQRDAITNAVELERKSRPELDKFFGEDRQNGFFVNSLEAVQGDERDVIIFSIGYGPDEMGRIYKGFGPLNRAGGERRLNVAITRAKQLVEIVSSMSSSEMGDVTAEGAMHLRKYLDFAERGVQALQIEMGNDGLDTDSPFEDSVLAAVRSWGYEVQPQVGVAGYRIDIGVKHPNNPGAFILGIECDGAQYHSPKAARDRDRLRHEVLEGLGWEIHHIWGTAWYRHRSRELERLKQLLEDRVSLPVVGRLSTRMPTEEEVEPEIQFEAVIEPDYKIWTEEYALADLPALPAHVDFAEQGSETSLVDFVEFVVSVEEPLHIDLLVKRLRTAGNIGKVGTKIRDTLDKALVISKVQRDDDFLWSSSARECSVRRPGPFEMRGIELISDLEIRGAILKIVDDAIGIGNKEISRSLGEIFGWQRIGQKIQGRFDEAIDALLEEGALMASGDGYKVS